MKKILFTLCALLCALNSQAQWSPAGNRIKTEWASRIDPENVLPEYPRPQMERKEWSNLNGLWEYSIQKKGTSEPASYDGNILVPFAIESSLSGVQKEVGEGNELWYKRSFNVPSGWKNRDILLHFGAVDWKADVFVNDVLIGSHQGGYTPFSFNITPYLTGYKNQKLVVRVWDPTQKGYQPVGKQTSAPKGIWYTSVTGIWQTVWMEPVNKDHVTGIKAIPDVDTGTLSVIVSTNECKADNIVEVKLVDKGKTVATAKGLTGKELRLTVDSPVLWSPETPYLYDLEVNLFKAKAMNSPLDRVKSYSAFRKISVKRDAASGFVRMQLNDKDYFLYGPLDQGWWPDGLYTAPTDEALLFDIQKTKEFGFNTIRKHVKVEPARWYYHCDKEGILVWQDMPSGDMGGNKWANHTYNGGTDRDRSPESIENYYNEWKEIMDLCMSSPCVIMWVPFNEAWGQHDAEGVADWTKKYDPSRLVNPASGGNFRDCGDVLDLHNYPDPRIYLLDDGRVNVLGEYGGIGLALEGHLWMTDKNWGYVQFKTKDEVTRQYVKYAEKLQQLVGQGFSAAIYTQTTDVEGEVNGLITYDRKVIKVDAEAVRKANEAVINELSPVD